MSAGAERCDDDELRDIAGLIANASDEDALRLLDRAVVTWPRDARLRFLRGSIAAQAGQYDRAVDDFRLSIDIEPYLDIARFQLGLLHLTSGRPHDALDVWALLDRLSDDDCLKLFKRGLAAMIEDRFPECIQWLQEGIERNNRFPPLSRDMQMVITQVRSIAAGTSSSVQGESAGHVLLAGYLQSKTKH